MKSKRILVTGADGFIGSHLVEKLVSDGNIVIALVQYNSFNNWGWIDTFDNEIKDKIKIVPGDIRDSHAMLDLVKDVDLVFHLAALIAIPYSYNSPEMYIDTNVKGTLNILQACKINSIHRVIVTSTSEVYGSAKYVPIDENHPLQGQSPYSASKIASDKIAESFYKSFNLPISIVRPFNTYGPRQSARAIIPTIITQLLLGNSTINLGSLEPTRDFNYVKDTVDGFIDIADSIKTIGHEINIASQKEISVRELTSLLINLINPTASVLEDKIRLRPINSEVNRLLGSNKKIKELTNWQQKYTLEMGLKETIAFFRNNLNKYKPNIYNI